MFGYVMSDPGICKRFLEQLLGIEIDHVEYLEKEKTIEEHIDARGVRLDIYMSDGKTVYDCEMQTTEERSLPKRIRYYQGQIDMGLLEKGESFGNLKSSLIIFICTFDMFKKDRFVYTFTNRCIEDPSIVMDDGTKKVIINTKGAIGSISDDFLDLMQYFNEPGHAVSAKNDLVRIIDNAVKAARSSEKWRHDFMTLTMYLDEQTELARTKGRNEGLIEGRAEGLIEGRTEGLIEGRAEGLIEGRNEGRVEGRVEGSDCLADLIKLLIAENREDDVEKVLSDRDFRNKLLKKYFIAE